MRFLQLNLDARYKIYAQTKKVLRKYQKGIVSGKLTSEQFVDNMLEDPDMTDILKGINVSVPEFRDTYKEYVDTLIEIQNKSLPKQKEQSRYYSQRASFSSIFKLNEVLLDNGYDLSIPAQYLTQCDIDCIEKFVKTGNIDLGNEKIFNYVVKTV
ncbi:hypothetical protein [Peptostreptococcus russellii]|uniref:hypothetical protein n=1 Tax=Peptostreptococcus russellii TaxID=215200 RepID=UPI003F58ADAA